MIENFERVLATMQTLTEEELAGIARISAFPGQPFFDNDIVLAFGAAASRYLLTHDWDDVYAFIASHFTEVKIS